MIHTLNHERLSYDMLLPGSTWNTQRRLYSNRAKIRKMWKSKTLKHQRQNQEGNGKTELEEIREDNIQAAKKQNSKTNSKEEKNRTWISFSHIDSIVCKWSHQGI